MTPPRARSVVDWLNEGRDAIDATLADVERVTANGSPLVEPRLTHAVRLCQRLVELREMPIEDIF